MSLIGKIVEHEGLRYQILTETGNLLLASLYGEDCGIAETIFVSKKDAKIIARKTYVEKKDKQKM